MTSSMTIDHDSLTPQERWQHAKQHRERVERELADAKAAEKVERIHCARSIARDQA